MTEMTLAAAVRQGTGKGVARKLRRAGQVPAIVYGLGDPVAIQCDAHEAQLLVHALHGSERLISLRLTDGGKTADRHVLLKDVQTTPVGARLLHIDFHEVDVAKTVHVAVEVHPTGKAIGEREGGILQQVTYQVDVECLPMAIPEGLHLDVSELEIGGSLHVSDLQMPEGVTPLTPEDETLFVVAAPRVEEVVEEAEVAEEGEEAPEAGAEAAEGEEAPEAEEE
jgi:large subunit ribosomal protein L25